MRKSSVLTFALVFSIVTVLVALALPISVTADKSSRTTVYFDPPTINGTMVGEEFTVDMKIRYANEITGWGAGLIFNAALLSCTGVSEGPFLKDVNPSTFWIAGNIDNTAGEITQSSCVFFGPYKASGNGTLAHFNFKVKAPGVSDLHLRDVQVSKGPGVIPVPIDIIDVYTVIVDATAYKVVTVSNSTGKVGAYHSGFSDHAFNASAEELSFTVESHGDPFGIPEWQECFSNVTIPKTLLNVSNLDDWRVIIDGIPLRLEERTVTYNDTHHSIYFTYALGIHEVKITTRPLMNSIISIALSSTTINLRENVTISGNITADDPVDPVRANAPVMILYGPSGGTLKSLANVTTDYYSNYSYTWTPEAAGTYDVQAKWETTATTYGNVSDVKTLTVLKVSSNISINLSEDSITMGENVTISGNITADDPVDPVRANKPLTIEYIPTGGNWTLATEIAASTDLNSNYSYRLSPKIGFYPEKIGTYEFRARWDGDENTENATSAVKTLTVLKVSSNISINLSEDSITMGENVTISGEIKPFKPDEKVTIEYRPSGGTWSTLANVTTDYYNVTIYYYSNYSYTWTPEAAGTYEFRARWDGDENTENATSAVKTLTVEEAPSPPAGIDPYVVAGVAAVIIAIAAIAVYFVKFRKPKP